MATRAAFHSLRVGRVEEVADDAVALTLEVPAELREDYRFEPGQHITLRCADGGRRSYSICTTPDSGVLRIGIRQLPEGWFSRGVLPTLAVGDALEVMTPEGRFTARVDPTARKHYAAVAAGSGITPVLSIVASLLEGEPGSSLTILYANRTHASAMFLDEIHDLKDRYLDRFRILHVLSREQQQAELLSGRLDGDRLRAMSGTLLDITAFDEWFLCGPQEMVTDLAKTLADLGAGHVHSELFHAEPIARRVVPTAEVGDSAEVTVRLDGRSTTFRLGAADVPVLEAALRLRGDLPFACRGGVCGTCRARVVAGSVAMETNWALEDDEVAAGYALTCQAHPTSDEVVLDYDA